jgi:hypothetical protein
MPISFNSTSGKLTPVAQAADQNARSGNVATYKGSEVKLENNKKKHAFSLPKHFKKAKIKLLKLTKLFAKKSDPAKNNQASHLSAPVISAQNISLTSDLREYTCAGMIRRMNDSVDTHMGGIPLREITLCKLKLKLKYENLLREKIAAIGGDNLKPVSDQEYRNAHKESLNAIYDTSKKAVTHIKKITDNQRRHQTEYHQYLRDSSAPGYDKYFDDFIVQRFDEGLAESQPFKSVPQPLEDAKNFLSERGDAPVGFKNTPVPGSIHADADTTTAATAAVAQTEKVPQTEKFVSAESLRNRWNNLLNDPELSRLLSRGKTPGTGA